MIWGKPKPNLGEIVHARRFLWVPNTLTDGRWAWLCWVEERKEYVRNPRWNIGYLAAPCQWWLHYRIEAKRNP